MPASFHPPGIALKDIDTADSTYGDTSIVIEGVVTPGGQGGWEGETDGYEVHCFSFSAWRGQDEPAKMRYLTILRPVPRGADYFDDFPAYSVQRIRVLLSSDETRAIFQEAFPVKQPNAELVTIAEKLQQPVVISTKLFGDLVLDREMDWFEAETKWNGITIRLTVPTENDAPDPRALEVAESLWEEQAAWKQRIDDYAVKELLELKNDGWLDENEPAFTSDKFISAMTLTSISIDYDGEIEFWFDDGDLFWGHAIMVQGNLKDGPVDAGIHG